MKSIFKALIVLFLISTVDVSFCSCMGWFQKGYVMNSFQGQVIDTDTKEPIEEAVVVAVYQKGNFSVAGSGSSDHDVQEVLTDKNGEFKIPETFVESKEMKGRPSAYLMIFKPGYGTLDHKRAKAIGVNKSWPPAEKHIVYELPKLITKEQRKVNVPGSIDGIPFKKQILYLRAINQECLYVGIPPYPLNNLDF